jgi:ribosomal-protein-alanine N-acetyltransferase
MIFMKQALKEAENMSEIETTIHAERLDLILMTPTFFEAAMRGDQAKAAQLLGVPIPADWWPVSGHIHMRLEQARRNPALEPWLGRAIVLRSSQTMVGTIAFHMAPEPEPVRPLGSGGVEFGYTVFPSFRRQGYATEASLALMTWAQQQGVTRFVLSISPENQPSLRIAAHFGFVKIGSQMDEKDGFEDIYERCFVA